MKKSIRANSSNTAETNVPAEVVSQIHPTTKSRNLRIHSGWSVDAMMDVPKKTG